MYGAKIESVTRFVLYDLVVVHIYHVEVGTHYASLSSSFIRVISSIAPR